MDPYVIPLIILLGAFGLFYLGLRGHQVRMLHEERMRALDKGVDIKPILLNATPAFGHRVYLLRGLVWLFAGAALMAVLAVTAGLFQSPPRSQAMILQEKLVRISSLRALGATDAQLQVIEKELERGEPHFRPTPPLLVIGIIPMSVGLAYLIFYALEEKRVRKLPPA